MIVEIWKASEQPCGLRLKATLPLWMKSHASHYGVIDEEVEKRILSCSARTLERITLAHRLSTADGKGRGRPGGPATGSRSSCRFGVGPKPLTGLGGSRHRFPRGSKQQWRLSLQPDADRLSQRLDGAGSGAIEVARFASVWSASKSACHLSCSASIATTAASLSTKSLRPNPHKSFREK